MNPVAADTEAPKVTDLVIEPVVGGFPTVDVRISSQVVTFTVSVTDDDSGVNRVAIAVTGHEGSDRSRGVSEVYEPCRTTACGTVTEVVELGKTRILGGKYVITKTIPALSAGGQWKVQYVEVEDMQGNTRTYEAETFPEGNPKSSRTGYNFRQSWGFYVVSGDCDNTPYHCQPLSTYFDVDSGRARHNANDVFLFYRFLWQLEGMAYFSTATADTAPNSDSGLSRR